VLLASALIPLIFVMLESISIFVKMKRGRDLPLLLLRPSFFIVPKNDRVGVGSTTHGDVGCVGMIGRYGM